MKCPDVQARWAALLDRALDESTRSAVEEHLGSCGACEREHQSLLAAESMLQRHARIQRRAPEGFADRLMRRLDVQPGPSLVREVARLAIAAGVLLAAFGLVAPGFAEKPIVRDMSARVENTRQYVTEELPKMIADGLTAVWKGSHE